MTARREFLAHASATSITGMLSVSAATGADSREDDFDADAFSLLDDLADRSNALASLYDADRTIVNLDAAYYGAMTKQVHAAYRENLGWVNRFNSTFLRGAVANAGGLEGARSAVAALMGASSEEVALCGGVEMRKAFPRLVAA